MKPEPNASARRETPDARPATVPPPTDYGRRSFLRLLPSAAAAACLLPSLSGCNVIGPIAAVTMPEPKVPARYTNFQGQTLAVMVWADNATAIDHPSIQLDVATSLQSKLQQLIKGKDNKPAFKYFEGASFPWPAASVVRFQQDHPDTEGQPVTDVAPRLQVSRLIYIEVENFQTRADSAVELYRGSISAILKVIEVKDGRATVGYEESPVATTYPPGVPEEGTPNFGDRKIYVGLVDRFTTSIVHRFVTHEEDKKS